MTQLTTPLPRLQRVALGPATTRRFWSPAGATPLTGLRSRPRVRRLGHLAGHVLATLATLALLVPGNTPLEPVVGGALVVLWPALLAIVGCYVVRPVPEHLAGRLVRVVRAGAILGLGCWFVTTLSGAVGGAVSESLAFATVILVAASMTATTIVGLMDRTPARVAVVGSPQDVSHAVAELRRSPQRCEPAVACLTEGSLEGFGGLPSHVGVEDAVDVAVSHGADVVLVLPGGQLSTAVERRLEWTAAHRQIPVCLGTTLLDVAPARTSVLRAGGMDVLHVRPAPVCGPFRVAKDIVERALATIALALVLPALLGVGLAIRRGSPGGALFRQDRVGKDGRLFTMYKFRTMGRTAEQQVVELAGRNDADGVLFKVHDDPRVTRIGAILRRYSIDELPQLWNVVKGEMSLVGPRPALPQEVACYDLDPRHRLVVKPGMTGLWQVSGRSDLSWDESVRLDIQYVDNWSPGLDLAILCRTFRAVVTHRGAY